MKLISTRLLAVEVAAGYQDVVQLQLTAVLPVAGQGDGCSQSDGAVGGAALWGGGALHDAAVSAQRQSQTRILRHGDLTAQQGIMAAAEVKGHGIWNDTLLLLRWTLVDSLCFLCDLGKKVF